MTDVEKAKILTDYMHSISHTDWTYQMSLDYVQQSPVQISMVLDSGKVHLEIVGDVIEVNGKDITGNSGINLNNSNLNLGGSNVAQTINNVGTATNTPASSNVFQTIIIPIFIIVIAAGFINKFGWNRTK